MFCRLFALVSLLGALFLPGAVSAAALHPRFGIGTCPDQKSYRASVAAIPQAPVAGEARIWRSFKGMRPIRSHSARESGTGNLGGEWQWTPMKLPSIRTFQAGPLAVVAVLQTPSQPSAASAYRYGNAPLPLAAASCLNSIVLRL